MSQDQHDPLNTSPTPELSPDSLQNSPDSSQPVSTYAAWCESLNPEVAKALRQLGQESPEAKTGSTDNSQWHLVICRDGEVPTCVSGDLVEMVTALLEVLESKIDTRFFVFKGDRAFTSRGPDRYLLWPDGFTRTPLFHTPDADADVEIDEVGAVGVPEEQLLEEAEHQAPDEDPELVDDDDLDSGTWDYQVPDEEDDVADDDD